MDMTTPPRIGFIGLGHIAEVLDVARTLGYEHRDLAGLVEVLEQMAARRPWAADYAALRR
jgi:hypothetical protein